MQKRGPIIIIIIGPVFNPRAVGGGWVVVVVVVSCTPLLKDFIKKKILVVWVGFFLIVYPSP